MKYLVRRFVKKVKIGFWKKPMEYLLLAAVMVAIVVKYRNPIQDLVFDRSHADSKEFYYKYYDHVERYSGQE